jgi:hydroxypyruvate reductase 1
MQAGSWRIVNPEAKLRVVVTKELPGQSWLDTLTRAGCRVEVGTASQVLGIDPIKAAIGDRCDAAIGQLTENWGEELFAALSQAGGKAYSNYAVGYNNVDLAAATRHGIAVGNTPGVLTETTAEMAVALTFAAARRIGEAERFMRAGRYAGWLPSLFLGTLLRRKTVGVIGAGRIGAAYGRMMVEGFKMDLIYHDRRRNQELEDDIRAYAAFLESRGQSPVSCRRAQSLAELLKTADCVSVHTILDESTRHLINAESLRMMKPDALLINTSRGPVIDETALVAHCRTNSEFRAGLDVFENEPDVAPGLDQLQNVVMVPHIASATGWTREGMATLAACNVAGILSGYPAWQSPDIEAFLQADAPCAAPSIVNAEQLNYPVYGAESG